MHIKNTEKKLVGQPIFKQLIDPILKNKFDTLVSKHNADRYYKQFTSWDHLLTMLFTTFGRCDSMDEKCAGMMGKLNHLGLGSSRAKSTASKIRKKSILALS